VVKLYAIRGKTESGENGRGGTAWYLLQSITIVYSTFFATLKIN